MKSTFRFALASLALAAPAAAQPVTSPADVVPADAPAAPSEAPADAPVAPASAALGVEVLDPEHTIDITAVRDSIGRELDITTTDATAFAPGLGRLEIAIERGVVRIAYHPAAGTVIERTLALPPDPQERVQLIAFVATNLVRDQAAEVLGGLPVIPPLPAAAPPPVRRAPPSRWMAATLGFVPPLSIDRAVGQRVAVGVGLHAVMGMTDETTIASVSGAVDLVTENMHGIQVGGAVAATLGHARGLQLGGAVALARGSLYGAQVGGAATVAAGASTGLQVAGAASVAEKLYGAQIAGAAAANQRIDGLQLAGGVSASKFVHGGQIAGAVAVAGPVEGLQLAGGIAVASRVNGAQIAGGINVGGDVSGVQIGAINVARKMRGVQIGAINLSDDGDDSFPIGVINYSRNGGVAFDGWVDSSRVSALGFRHGTKHVHNIWSVGWSPDHDNFLVGAGLGISHRLADSVGIDIDAMHWLTDAWDIEYGQIDQLRASIALPLGMGLEAFGGVAANVYITDVMKDNAEDFHPTMERTYQPTDSTKVVVWPTAFAGIRARVR